MIQTKQLRGQWSLGIKTLILVVCISKAFAQFKCPEDTGFFPDPVQCDLYYDCNGGKAEEKLCPDGLVFDDSKVDYVRCDLPANINCGDRIELQEPKPSDGCPRSNGVFRHRDNLVCDKFVNCVDGNPNEVPCPPGLIFDDSRSNCVWPADARRTDCLKSKRDSLADGFSCPEGEVIGPNGRVLPHPTFAHPEDCQKFYICRNGVTPQYGSCSDGTVYNDATFQCDDPENVPGCENWYKDEDKKNEANQS